MGGIIEFRSSGADRTERGRAGEEIGGGEDQARWPRATRESHPKEDSPELAQTRSRTSARDKSGRFCGGNPDANRRGRRPSDRRQDGKVREGDAQEVREARNGDRRREEAEQQDSF